ncbi:MAG: hypothetical protein IPF98_16675 [Gemmatimonadetes bacterium]|nr:hypothetical protein [Gemmatimonadota bacterium]
MAMGATSRIVLPTLTPDSRLLFWMVEAGQRSMMDVWLDGRMICEFDAQGSGHGRRGRGLRRDPRSGSDGVTRT